MIFTAAPHNAARGWRSPWFGRFVLSLGLGALANLTFSSHLRAEGDEALPAPSILKTLSVDELMDIQVTSVSLHPEKLSQTASAIQVITSDDIRRSGATSVPEALRLASNLEVAQIDSRQWAITARGFNNLFADKLLVLIDGRSVYTPLYAGVYWDVQDTMLEDVDRIEVISGPGATQWGANAVNGVINVTTKNARDTQGALLSTGAGSELRNSTEARYGGQIAPNLFYRVYAKYFDRGDSTRPDHRKSNDAWHVGQAGFRADWDPQTDNVVTVQGDAYDGTMGQVGPDNIRVNGGNVLGRWSRTLAENSEVKLQAYYDHTHRRIPNSFTQDLDTYDVDFQHRLPVGSRNDVQWGLGYRLVQDDVLNTPANAFLPAQVARQSFTGFLQDDVTLVPDRWHATVGSKVEHNDYTGFEFEPSLRLSWTPDARQTVWSAISRAVRTPSRIDRDLYSPATPPYRITGGAQVVSEKLSAYELGYRVQLNPQLAASVATFINEYHDLRSLEPLDPPAAFPVARSSGLQGRSAGIEISMDWRATAAWRWHAGFTQLSVHSEPEAGSLDRSTRDSVVRDPPYQGALRSMLDLGRKWELDVDLRYVGRVANQAVPGYTEGDVRLAWTPVGDWEFSLVGQNLLHVHHAEFNVPGARREIQRSVFGNVSWRF